MNKKQHETTISMASYGFQTTDLHCHGMISFFMRQNSSNHISRGEHVSQTSSSQGMLRRLDSIALHCVSKTQGLTRLTPLRLRYDSAMTPL